ncbi:MAG: TRAP transporter substrate-binding protein [Aestuariivita sp.]|uniref:TRAP transporter substrate-binding protein n=1 Tax=Aestuariivita sp. TaxID=1872407 RepID=UPI003BAE8E68
MKNFLSALAIVTAVTAPSLGFAQDKNFRVGLITPPVHVWNKEVDAMGVTLGEMSEGRLGVTAFPSGQLGNEGTMLQQLQTGALDMAWLTTAGLTLRVPDMSALHAPFLVTNIADAAKILRSDEAREILDALPAATGTVGLCYAMTGMRQVMAKEPITSVEDLDGLRFRITPAPPIQTFFEAFGAAPAPMPLTQVYDSLANGQIDAIDMDHESILNFGYYDHAKNMLETNHQLFGMVALVSGRVWAQLSDEDKAIVQEAAQKHCDRTIDLFVSEEESKLERLKAIEGLTIVENVGPEFFGDIVERWDAEWSAQTPYLARLRALAATF